MHLVPMINPFPNSIKKEIHLKREIQGNSFNPKLKIILEKQKIGEWVLCPQFKNWGMGIVSPVFLI